MSSSIVPRGSKIISWVCGVVRASSMYLPVWASGTVSISSSKGSSSRLRSSLLVLRVRSSGSGSGLSRRDLRDMQVRSPFGVRCCLLYLTSDVSRIFVMTVNLLKYIPVLKTRLRYGRIRLVGADRDI